MRHLSGVSFVKGNKMPNKTRLLEKRDCQHGLETLDEYLQISFAVVV